MSAIRSAPILKLAELSTPATAAPGPAPASSPFAPLALTLGSLAAAAAEAEAAPAPAAAEEEVASTTRLLLPRHPALDAESWLLLFHTVLPRRHENLSVGDEPGPDPAPPRPLSASSLSPAAACAEDDWRTVRWCPPPPRLPPLPASLPPPSLRQRPGRSSSRDPAAARSGDEEKIRRGPLCPPPAPPLVPHPALLPRLARAPPTKGGDGNDDM